MPAFSRSRPKASREGSEAVTQGGSRLLLMWNEDLAYSMVQVVQVVKACDHETVHPLHIAFSFLYRLEDIKISGRSPLAKLPARPILDVPLLWTILVRTRYDPDAFGEKLRSKLIKPDSWVQYGQGRQHSEMAIPIKILEDASEYANSRGDLFLATHHVLRAIFDDPDIKTILEDRDLSISTSELIKTLESIRSTKILRLLSEPYYMLQQFAEDLTERANKGQMDAILCRGDEIYRLICILSRRVKKNALLIGDPGVGKTALVEGLAQRIIAREVPLGLNGRILSLDLARLVAGTSCQGVYEKRVEALLQDIERMEDAGNPIFLFIDNFHLVMTGRGVGGEGGLNAANLFKPMLARGKLHCIGAVTPEEYQKCITTDGALERRFAQIVVRQASLSQTKTILRGARDHYEQFHGVHIDDKALIVAAEIAKRYKKSQRLPDSALDIVDEACARAQIENGYSDDLWKYETQRKRCEVDMNSLRREQDSTSRAHFEDAKRRMQDIERQLPPLKEKYARLRKERGEIKLLGQEIEKKQGEIKKLERMRKFKNARELREEVTFKISEYEGRREEMEMEMREKMVGTGAIGRAEIEETFSLQNRNPGWKGQSLTQLENDLSRVIVGQENAVTAMINSIAISNAGLENPLYPLASLLFIGPSGCGKTYAVRMLAQSLFHSTDYLITINGSDYCDAMANTRLIGTAITCTPFDMAGELTEFVKRKPHCIVLVNEADKLCSEVVAMFSRILDNGELNDGNGDPINFRNCFIIFTATLSTFPGRNDFSQGIFSTDFFSRLDDVVPFRQLSSQDLKAILNFRLQDLKKRLEVKSITLVIPEEHVERLWEGMATQATLPCDIDRLLYARVLSSISTTLLRQGDVAESRIMSLKVEDDGSVITDIVTDIGQREDGAD